MCASIVCCYKSFCQVCCCVHVPKQQLIKYVKNLWVLLQPPAEDSLSTRRRNGSSFSTRFLWPSLSNKLRCGPLPGAWNKSSTCTWDGPRRTAGSRSGTFESSWSPTCDCSGSRPCCPRSRHTHLLCWTGGNILLDTFPLEENKNTIKVTSCLLSGSLSRLKNVVHSLHVSHHLV